MPGETVYVDYAERHDVAAMVIGGVTVVERVLRLAARAGATAAVVRGDIPPLPALPLDVTVIARDASPPSDTRAIAGDVIAGVRIEDEATRRTASRALFQTCRNPYDGFGDRYVIRAISLRLSSVMCRIGVTPNQVTSGNIAVGLAACLVAGLASGAWSWFALAGALMFVQVVLDCCDGEIARIRFMSSRFGMWLDNVSDDVIDNLFLAMLGIGLGGFWMPLAIAASVGRSVVALMIHVDVARRGRAGDVMSFQWFFDRADEQLAERFEVAKPSLLAVARGFGRRDLYVLTWSASCLAGLPQLAITHGLAIAVAYLVLAIIHLSVMRARRRAARS